MIYKTLVLTGLRKNELALLRSGNFISMDLHPFAELAAADEKNRQGSTIPLRADLADDIRRWLADRAAASQQAASKAPTIRFESQAGRDGDKRLRSGAVMSADDQRTAIAGRTRRCSTCRRAWFGFSTAT